MPIKLGSRPEHGFDQPLGLLSDCHRRIENFLSILSKVVQQAAGRSLSPEERRAAEVALEYFRSAAPRHTADEEQSLFPVLRASNDPGVQKALQTMQALEHDHAVADQRHADVDALFRRWLELGTLTEAQTRKLSEDLNNLQQLYARHIAIEDDQLFPLAQQVLTREQVATLGAQMANRRGLPAAQ